jgi:hypothetical protein
MFDRGWTLQELIAPASVEFFSQEHDRLGSKRSLEETIHEITGIAIEALRGASLPDFEIEERFSWADSRETKRREDKAYSLLGILTYSCCFCIVCLYHPIGHVRLLTLYLTIADDLSASSRLP